MHLILNAINITLARVSLFPGKVVIFLRVLGILSFEASLKVSVAQDISYIDDFIPFWFLGFHQFHTF